MMHMLTLKSDLGDQLLISSLAGTEALGQLFSYRFSLISPDDTLDLRALLGTTMTTKLEVGTAYKRYLGGIVTEISQTGFEARDGKRYAAYAALIQPKPWLLSQKIDSRIFKNLSVPEMVRSLLGEIGYTDIELRLSRTYPPREYCVQYREDCLNFVSRLMEEEGIYYYFVHSENTHTMVLADSFSAHASTTGYAELPYSEAGPGKASLVGVQSFAVARSVHTTKYTLTDYDPLKPRASLQVEARSGNDGDLHPVAGLESFDFPGDHSVVADGSRHASARIEGLSVPRDRYSGTSNAPGLVPGALFKLLKLPRADLNVEYLVVGTTISIKGPQRVAGGNDDEPWYDCTFQSVGTRNPYCSPMSAVRPIITGLQTAVVCGSDDAEDIVVDKYGRVQVIFHWLKSDRKFHDVSCPVRVASSWAGKQWGMVHIPRVGQEVVVSFLEGDPDRPLIIGSVYNADNMPPYALPDNKTQSGIKSRSHQGGAAANFNEFRFEDKKGSEEVYLHAEKDLREMVENDHFVEVGNDETEVIKRDRIHTIERDEKFEIKNNRTHKVGKEDKLDVGANATTDVKEKYKLTAGTEIELVTGQSSIKMTSAGDITIKGVNIKIEGSVNVETKAGVGLKASGGVTMEVTGGVTGKVEAAMLNLTGSGMASLGGGLIKIG